jgi:hypothetical protein
MATVDELLDEYTTEISELVAAKAQHVSALHESDAAKKDDGGMRFCPGCRLITLTKRMSDLVSARDDNRPQARFGGKSHAQHTVDRLSDRKTRETPREAPAAGAGRP